MIFSKQVRRCAGINTKDGVLLLLLQVQC